MPMDGEYRGGVFLANRGGVTHRPWSQGDSCSLQVYLSCFVWCRVLCCKVASNSDCFCVLFTPPMHCASMRAAPIPTSSDADASPSYWRLLVLRHCLGRCQPQQPRCQPRHLGERPCAVAHDVRRLRHGTGARQGRARRGVCTAATCSTAARARCHRWLRCQRLRRGLNHGNHPRPCRLHSRQHTGCSLSPLDTGRGSARPAVSGAAGGTADAAGVAHWARATLLPHGLWRLRR